MDYNEIKDGANRLLKSLERIVVAVTVIVFWSVLIIGAYIFLSDDGSNNSSTDHSDVAMEDILNTEKNDQENCNVFGLRIHGAVVTYHPNDVFDSDQNLTVDQTSADEILYFVQKANKDEKIKGILVEIDSHGGSPVGGEEIMNAFKNSSKPVVAYIRGIGTSAAYLAATGAQTIFASKWSDIGSIGVTYSYLDYTEKNRREGIKFIELSSGKFKDTGSPDKPLTKEEKDLYQRDLDIIYNNFVQLVAQNRKLNIADVYKLADGSTIMGEAALKAGLIDKIGSYYDAKEFIKEKIGSDVEVCWQN